MNVRKNTVHLSPIHDAMLKVLALEPWYREGKQHDCNRNPNKCNVATIADNAANIEREMRSQQTDGEEGHTSTDVRPHVVGTVACSLFFELGYCSHIDNRVGSTFCN